MRRPLPGYRWLIPVIGSLVVLAAPTPAGLSLEGQRVLAVLVLAIGLWGLEALPPGVTGVLAIVALVLTGAVAGIREALVGFADPIPYFLIGVLTMGVAVARSGLARAGGPRAARAGPGPRRRGLCAPPDGDAPAHPAPAVGHHPHRHPRAHLQPYWALVGEPLVR